MTEPNPSRHPWHRRLIFGSDPKRTLRRGFLLALFTFLLVRYVYLPVRLQGVSMEPTLHGGDIHVANLLKYAWRDPRRGDIVVISMTGRHAFYLKRVLGLPGETIAFDRGQLYVNDQPTPEPYLMETGMWKLAATPVGGNEFFVAGDNRDLPIELHTIGTVNRSKIMGGLLR
jgi:signal peptidase I